MRNSTKEQVKSGLNMPLTISQVRSAALMTNGLNMPLAKLQERSAVLMKDPMLQVKKNGNMPLEFQERSKVCRAYEGFHETQRCYYLFQKKALKDRPQAACPKIVKQTLKYDSILKEQVKRWARDGGKEKEKVDSAFFE